MKFFLILFCQIMHAFKRDFFINFINAFKRDLKSSHVCKRIRIIFLDNFALKK